jgi:queuine tRNA-ribosyltransferase
VRPLHLVSFSEDLAPLRLALHHKRHFPYLRHGAADTLIRRDRWESRYCPGLQWTLVPGTSVEGELPRGEMVLGVPGDRK